MFKLVVLFVALLCMVSIDARSGAGRSDAEENGPKYVDQNNQDVSETDEGETKAIKDKIKETAEKALDKIIALIDESNPTVDTILEDVIDEIREVRAVKDDIDTGMANRGYAADVVNILTKLKTSLKKSTEARMQKIESTKQEL